MTNIFQNKLFAIVLAVVSICVSSQAGIGKPLGDEDGYKLWLRYASLGELSANYDKTVTQIRVEGNSATCEIIRNEMKSAAESMLGRDVPLSKRIENGTVIIGKPADSAFIRDLNWCDALTPLGDEGFIIRSVESKNKQITVIAANSDIGALYGSYHFLRLIQTAQPVDSLDITEMPALQLRLMNHWDNINGGIERGYAGRSLWQWNELPEKIRPRYVDYARACASIGINGVAPNNVNADPRMLTAEYLRKVAALADLWRPYGIKIYLSVNFASPIKLSGLKTADPLDPDVINWWKVKADEIYEIIPDFGGFLIKANSEGQPGPKTYGRTHAQGANLLADALAPHNGIVMWRAFVYDIHVDADRTKRPYIEFTALDGQFRPNVVIQVKNGTIDFQPREPFHPLFGGMKKTPVIAEIQASQEYLGQAKHLVYHGPMWKEFLEADTYAKGEGATVAKVMEGKIYPYSITGMVSVTNPGLDANWCGHHFSQSNWFVFGRLAWDPDLSAEQIAEEWARMTFTNDEKAVSVICKLMMDSHETFVDYSMPLGLNGLIGGNHYAPMPWFNPGGRPDWTATYYHKASKEGIGYDRTSSGSNAVSQYFPPVCDIFNDLSKCPEKYLLWFHRLPWDYKMKSGNTLWEAICDKYKSGAARTVEMQKTWQSLEGKIDSRRHKEIADRLAIQAADAAKWRDDILKYFGQFAENKN